LREESFDLAQAFADFGVVVGGEIVEGEREEVLHRGGVYGGFFADVCVYGILASKSLVEGYRRGSLYSGDTLSDRMICEAAWSADSFPRPAW
jgi:hypothetical protein